MLKFLNRETKKIVAPTHRYAKVANFRCLLGKIQALCCGLMALSGSVLAAETTTLFVIGDTGDCSDGARRVSEAILRDPDAAQGWLLELGDLAYATATRERLLECHEPFFGPQRFAKRLAVPGNHDARDPGLAGFRSLFPQAVPRAVDFENWRLLMLDSNLRDELWGRQIVWTQAAIKESAGRCLIAAWHHPAWSSGRHGDNAFAQPLWAQLAGVASFTLHGHDHHYERLAPRDAAGTAMAKGTPSFVAGNGGASLYPLPERLKEGSVATFKEWGYLRLDLAGETYRWKAVGVSGRVFDEGRGECRPVPR
jgi:hypothetical protein